MGSTFSTSTSLALGVACFVAAVAARADAPPPIPAEAIRQDLAYLYENLQEAHYDLYVHRSKADYDAYYRKVVASVDGPLTRADAVRLVQRFAAYGRVEHARIDAGINEFMAYFKAGGVLLPLLVRVAAGRAYLLQSPCLSGALPAGTEIVRVEGDPIKFYAGGLTPRRSSSAFIATERQRQSCTRTTVFFTPIALSRKRYEKIRFSNRTSGCRCASAIWDLMDQFVV